MIQLHVAVCGRPNANRPELSDGPLAPRIWAETKQRLLSSAYQYKHVAMASRPPTLDFWAQKGLGRKQGRFSIGASCPLDEIHRLCGEGELERALIVLRRMDQQGTVPTVKVYSSLLKACAKRKALSQAKQVHTHLAQHGLESRFLGENVVSTLVKCGSLEDAVQVFDKLQERTVFSWTALISGHTMAGQGQEALRMYCCMREQGVEPDKYTFVSLLSACGSIGHIEEGKRIHAEVLKYRCESDVFVGTSLTDMYGKCGSIVDAQNVFDRLPQRTVVTWNVIVSANAQHGRPEKALQLYKDMVKEGVNPDDRTFVGVLQACSMLGEKEEAVLVEGQFRHVRSLTEGKNLHVDAQRNGYDSDAFVGSALVNMYAKCGSIVDAKNVFDGLSQRNVVLWNVMVAAYAQQDEPSKALQLYEQMREDSVSPDDRTFVSVLQACGMLAEKEENVAMYGQFIKVEFLGKGKAIHADAWRKGCNSDVFVCSTLVSMYGKCGSLVEAHHVFTDGLEVRNVVLWNVMTAAHVEQDQAEKALELYVNMREEGVTPDVRTFVTALQACGMLADLVVDKQLSSKAKSLEIGKAIHADARRMGSDSNVFFGNSLLSVYKICGSIVDAKIVFDELSNRDVVSWNTMLSAFVEHQQAESALQLYERMRKEGLCPDVRTFLSVLQACAILAEGEQEVVVDGQSIKVRTLAKGKVLQSEACAEGHDSHLFVACTLISVYGKCGSILDAEHVFDGLPTRDVVSWTAMLAAYVEQGQPEKCVQLYGHMQEDGLIPDEFAVVHILQACSNIGHLDICREMHHNLESQGAALSLLVATTLIHAYGRCATMVDAQNVFDALPQADVVAWNALLAGYARQGNCKACLQYYEEMRLAGIHPNGVTFVALLSACSHAGRLEEGVQFFKSMSRDHDIAPELEHYVTMVDLLGRAGCFTEVEHLLSTMPMQPSLAMWMCLLGACQKYGKVVLGKQAFDCAVRLEPRYAAAYVLMSNIYTDAGLSDSAKEVHTMRRKEAAWKQPGQSWIEHAQEVHTFVVGDATQPEHKQLLNCMWKVSADIDKEHMVL